MLPHEGRTREQIRAWLEEFVLVLFSSSSVAFTGTRMTSYVLRRRSGFADPVVSNSGARAPGEIS